MDEKRALDVLVANACCSDSKLACNICPWYNTEDCKNTNFNDVMYEAVQTIIGGKNNEKNEIK